MSTAKKPADKPSGMPILLLGPTASGKSHLALRLAAQLDLEIISLDSAQVFKHMNIGTAKPSAIERTQVIHHLIDILEPTEAYSTAQFLTDCHALVAQIAARGKTPLIVGGTMLYARALLLGLDRLPPANPDIRQRLDAQAALHGWPALHARLTQIDPITAARLPPTDSQRIQRALEVFEITGQPLSSLFGQPAFAPLACKTVAIEAVDRAHLHRRIAARFDLMLEQGLIAEVAQLRARGDLHLGLPSMRCVGYRQVWEHLDNPKAESPAALRERGIVATRQLAKRQMTWLRSLPIQLRLPMADNGSISETDGLKALLSYARAV
jgi:tRNA dimethylallyltransferase